MAIPTDPANSTTLDSSDTSAMLELFRAALGPLHTDYYLKTFTRFDANDRGGPSWNWAAALLTLNWMALRQLWGAALVYFGTLVALVLLIFGIGRLIFQMSTEAQTVCLAALALLSVAVPGVFGNALLYSACRKKIEAALAVNATFADACAMLKRQASNRQRVIGLGIGNAVLLATAAYLALTFVNLPGLASHPDISTSKALGTITDATSTQAGLSQPQRTVLADPPAMAASATASSPTSVAPPIPMPPASAASAALAASAPTTASIPVLTSSAQTTSDTPPAAPVFREKIVETSKAEPAPKPAPKKTAQPKRAKDAPDKASLNSETPYLVNVGLFADENNARNAVAKLNDAGIPVLSSTLDTSKGKRTRVRAGPFDTQAEAQRAADKIIFLGLDAVIARK